MVVPRGAGLGAIARTLAEAGVIENPLLFKLGVRVIDSAGRLRAGEYRFPAAVSMRGAVDILESGRAVVRSLTVPEGLTGVEVIALLSATEALIGETGPAPPEGSLLPETYHFALDDDRAAMLGRMSAGMAAALAELWDGRTQGLPLKSPEEALVLASIVEKETGVAEERPLVASVFINRLKRGMRLQSDPTVVYGLNGGQGPLGRALTRKDLQAPSAYNTYLIDGLPPGPIANPGRASLAAVMNPAQTRYLYFVADGSGGHAFAETLAEHNRNVRRWRRLRTKAGQ